MDNLNITIEELSKDESQEYLDLFESFEFKNNSNFVDWYDSDEATNYIWLIDISKEKLPIGFIAYDIFELEQEIFIYIVKIFVLGKYKKYNNDSEVKLINNKRASTILFETIIYKGYNILTLTSANEKLSSYYKKEYNFLYNKRVCELFSKKVNKEVKGFLYLDLQQSNRNISKDPDFSKIFGI
ncbi:hypothetical protein [Aliarcobacter lanthieri]|uniref:hypothetical protein n=1 Tax=Aliarcobacter lanthieri TaxID=1355374 RepID=UPI00047B319C|nr:hypothetical protein [Aliarcobacter lanthieri]